MDISNSYNMALNADGEILRVSDIEVIIKSVLDDVEIEQGIVGIKIPNSLGTVEEYEFLSALFHIQFLICNGIQQVIIPPPSPRHFSTDDKTQMEALARRVQRDHDDGIRYNRVYLAVYDTQVPDNVIDAHDIFIDVIKTGVVSMYEGKVYDARN